MAQASHRFDNAKRRRPEHHARQAMLTPAYVLEPIRELLGGIALDPCTDPDNPTQAERFYCLPADGAALPWDARNVFCNPPYGAARDRWVTRCIEAGRTGTPTILLIPAHTETRTFQLALKSCSSALFVQARLRFGVLRENRRQEAASHGSALLGFGGVRLNRLKVDGTPMGRLSIERGHGQRCEKCHLIFVGYDDDDTCRTCDATARGAGFQKAASNV